MATIVTLAGTDLLSVSRSDINDNFDNLNTELAEQMTFMGDWSSGTAYALNDVAIYSGVSYVAILAGTNHQPDSSPTYWTELGGTGGGSALAWQGAWSSGTAYAVDDLVSYNGSSYIAILSGTNHQPDTATTYWSLFAAAGSTGSTGSAGSAGADGPAGSPFLFQTDPPSMSDLTWVNQGSATGTNNATFLQLDAPASATSNIRALVQSTPSTPYTLTALLHFDLSATGDSMAGMCLRESSSGKFLTINLLYDSANTYYLQARKWDSATSSNSVIANAVFDQFSPGSLYLRITNNATNITFQWSHNGMNFSTLGSIGSTAFGTHNQWGIFANSENSLALSVGCSILTSGSLTPVSAMANGMNWQDAWSSSTSYDVNDVVYYSGSSYICVASNSNITPGSDTSKWQLIVSPETHLLTETRPTGTIGYIKQEKTTLPVSGSGFITIHDYTGGDPGYIANLWFGITGSATDTRNSTVLKITVDSVVIFNDRLPLYFAAEYQYNQTSFMSRFVSANNNNSDNVGFSSFIPIPFSSSFKIEIQNGSASTTGFVWASGIFHTSVANAWTRTRKLRTASGTVTGLTVNTVQTLVDVSSLNPGRMLGTFMSIDAFPGSASPQTACLEGNVKIYLDGAGSPNFETPGTEDYFLMSNYFQGYLSGACSDYFGLPIKSTYTFNMYRFHIFDPIVFENALKVTWNAGDSSQVNFTGSIRLSWCIWYYTE